MTRARTPVLLVHGLWLHKSSWSDWVGLLQEECFDPLAAGWPNEADTVEEAREHPRRAADQDLREVREHFQHLIQTLPRPPVLIGHGVGAWLVNLLLAEGLGVAGVLLAPTLHGAARPLEVVLTPERFQEVYGASLSREESRTMYAAWSVPSPAQVVDELRLKLAEPEPVETPGPRKGPSGRPRLILVPELGEAQDERLLQRFARDPTSGQVLERCVGTGPALGLDHGWREVALWVLHWLRSRLP